MTTSAEAHWFNRGGCCNYYKAVRVAQPVDRLVKKVSYERVRSYRTVFVKKLYANRCGCHRYYRSVAVQQPTVSVVRKVTWEHIRAYRSVVVRKLFRRHCCCR